MAVPAVAVGFAVTFLSHFAKFLLSGLLARVAFSLILNAVVFGAVLKFYNNFTAVSFDFALSFFSFFGFSDLVSQIQVYYSQLPSAVRDIWSYFRFGAILGFMVNSYIGGIFLSWICRKFG